MTDNQLLKIKVLVPLPPLDKPQKKQNRPIRTVWGDLLFRMGLKKAYFGHIAATYTVTTAIGRLEATEFGVKRLIVSTLQTLFFDATLIMASAMKGHFLCQWFFINS